MIRGTAGRLAAHLGFGVVVLWIVGCGSSPTTPSPPPASRIPAPAVDSPTGGVQVSVRPTLTVFNVATSEAAARTYEFQVAAAPDFGAPVVTRGGVPEGGGGKTSYTLTQDLVADTQYYWRARAVQGTIIGAWSSAPTFRTGRNSPPVIRSLSARGSRPNQPVNFADLDEEITVTAVVEDAETPADQLVYDWRAAQGVVIGNGSIVRWRAPGSVRTPATVAVTLTVRDSAASSAASATAELAMRLHDSVKEVGDLAVEFLTNFSKSDVAPETVVEDFTSSCPGRRDELVDAERNRRCFRIDSYTIGTPATTIGFGGTCFASFRPRAADGCVSVAVEWRSTYRSSDPECAPPAGRPVGTQETATGLDLLSAVYQGSRWWLCTSDFDGRTASGGRFKR